MVVFEREPSLSASISNGDEQTATLPGRHGLGEFRRRSLGPHPTRMVLQQSGRVRDKGDSHSHYLSGNLCQCNISIKRIYYFKKSTVKYSIVL